MIKDPVCGMEVTNENFSEEFKGRKFYFCSKGCLNKFKAHPKESSKKYMYDVIIIGGGPAGLTAAVYASVLKMDTFLITKDIGGQAIDSSKIKNYMGFDFIAGRDLVKKFKNQFLHEHYLAHKMDEVIKIVKNKRNFKIITKDDEKFLTKSVVIATGMKRRKLGIEGEERLQRKGVSYSSVQDITRFKGMNVVVVGGGNSGVQTANDLYKLSCNVTLVSLGTLTADESDVKTLKQHKKIKVLEGYTILKIDGKNKVESVVIQSRNNLKKETIQCLGVFIQVGLMPNTEFCQGLVNLNKQGEIIIENDCSTNVEGIFACGDVTTCFGKRIVIASGEGAKAVLRVKKYLLKMK